MTVRKINEYVEQYRQEAIDFLAEMLQTPSPTGQELEVSRVAERWMRADGLDVERHCLAPDRPNLLAVWTGNESGPRFMFNGHYDVFPPSEVKGHHRDPWSGEVIDGSIYGCGSMDMKAGLCAGIMAVKLLKRSGFVPNGSIVVSCDCDEEQGGKYGAAYLIQNDLLRADFGVCMESSENYVIVESDGRIEYKLTYHSGSWHAGTRLNQDDALRKAVRAINRLYDYDKWLQENRYHESEGGAILSITKIAAGTESNIHPTSCTVYMDRRYTKGETVESVTNELRTLLDKLASENSDMDYTLEAPIVSPQLRMDQDHPCIKAAISAYHDVFRKDITPGRRCGGGDTAKITTAYGYPLPQFGPGKFDQICSPDEHVELDDYIGFIKIYMNMVVRLLGDTSVEPA